MLILRFALLAGLLGLLVAPAPAQAPDYVSLAYSQGAGEVVVTLNGFPVVHNATETGAAGGQPVNLHLTPTGNQLEIDFRPADVSSGFSLSLSADAAGDVVDPESAGSLLTVEIDGADGPATVTRTFDLPAEWAAGFTAGSRYAALPVLEDEAALRAYATALQRAFADGDAAALGEHLRPAMEDRHAADPARFSSYPLDEFVRLSVAELPRLLEAGRLREAAPAATLVLTPWADGRLWQITRADGAALIVIDPEPAGDDQDGEISIPIFVGEVEGRLRVVR